MLGFCGTLFARVVYVPTQFETIQEGLDALTATDTLLVALGTYEEALVAPVVSFTMLGAIDSTSEGVVRPIIDVVHVELPDSTPLLLLQRASYAKIGGFHFRNGGRDCVRSWANGIAMNNCVVDSANYGIDQRQDSIGARVDIEDCEFRSILFTGVIVRYGNSLVARRCKFLSSASGMRALVSVSSSLIDSCEFSCNGGLRMLSAIRGPHVVTNCTFGPAVMSPFESAVSIGDTMPTFSNNTIIDCVYGNHAVRIGAILPDSAKITGNTFVRCTGLNVGLSAAGALGIMYTTWPTGQGAQISENTFIDCAGHVTADDIWPFVGFPALIDNNYFIHDSMNGLPSIGGSGGPWQGMPHTMRNNVFVNCGYALDGSPETDARFNYWGDPTGPYHEFENPQGLGDTITGPAQFIPWLEDTIDAIHDSRREMPSELTLMAYPNPFNQTTQLAFTLPKTTPVEIAVFDVLGRKVQTVSNEILSAGIHQVTVNGEIFASGVYFAKINTSVSASVTRLVLLK